MFLSSASNNRNAPGMQRGCVNLIYRREPFSIAGRKSGDVREERAFPDLARAAN
jgi:hypothetical protein